MAFKEIKRSSQLAESDAEEKCSNCGGRGYVKASYSHSSDVTCPACSGSGKAS